MPTPVLSDDNTLGPYRLIRKLGEGGMGTVHLAFDTQLERHVAIKLLRLNHDHSNHAALAKRFLREARAAAKLNHPHVVTVYSVGQHGAGDAARPYLVMEYLEAGSLADQLRKSGPLPWRDAAAVIADALLGLAAAHHAGIIHRDIKPPNLMRTGGGHTGQIKLVDFGLARAVYVPADAEITFPGAFVGSPSYASPEQITASPASRIDARSDLYSLAATFYALLTGQPPFIDDDPEEIMRRHTTDPFPDPREFAPDIPPDLLTFLAKASEKNPANRFIGAAEMHQALERLLSLPTRIKPALPSPVPPRPTRAHDSLAALESQLSSAQKSHDTPTQITTLRSLYGLYTQLDRPDQARTAFRQALALHIKLNPPATERAFR